MIFPNLATDGIFQFWQLRISPDLDILILVDDLCRESGLYCCLIATSEESTYSSNVEPQVCILYTVISYVLPSIVREVLGSIVSWDDTVRQNCVHGLPKLLMV